MVSLSLLGVDAYTIIFVVLLVVLILALLVVPMFTNKKRAKQTEELHRSLQPGDLIKTVGGIIGTIKEIRQVSPVDKEMVIETGEGDNKTTMVLDIQALYQVMSRNSTIVPAAEEENKDPEPSVEPAPIPATEEKAEEKTEEPAAAQEEKTEDSASPSVEKDSATPAPEAEQAASDAEPVVKADDADASAEEKKPAAKKPVNSKAKTAGGAKKTSGTKTSK